MTARKLALRSALAVFAALVALPHRSHAQGLAFTPPTPAIARTAPPVDSAATVALPMRDAGAVAFRPAGELNRNPAPARPHAGLDQSETLMIVGGAAIVAGIVVGGDAGHGISVAGAVIGLIGLYQYLQ